MIPAKLATPGFYDSHDIVDVVMRTKFGNPGIYIIEDIIVSIL